MRISVLFFGFFLGISHHAFAIGIGGYLAAKNDPSRIWTQITQIEAAKECKKKHSRMPTIRELVVDLGLTIASEADVNKYPGIPYTLVEALNLDGKIDRFYFTNFYYHPTSWYALSDWSSSVYLKDKSKAFILNSAGGWVSILPKNSYSSEGDWTRGDRSRDSAARCML